MFLPLGYLLSMKSPVHFSKNFSIDDFFFLLTPYWESVKESFFFLLRELEVNKKILSFFCQLWITYFFYFKKYTCIVQLLSKRVVASHSTITYQKSGCKPNVFPNEGIVFMVRIKNLEVSGTFSKLTRKNFSSDLMFLVLMIIIE